MEVIFHHQDQPAMQPALPKTEFVKNPAFWLAAAISTGINGGLGTLGLWGNAFLGLGIGLSSNNQANREIFNLMLASGICCPILFNLTGLGYGLAKRCWPFLGGWAAGILVGAVVIGSQIVLIAVYIWVITLPERSF